MVKKKTVKEYIKPRKILGYKYPRKFVKVPEYNKPRKVLGSYSYTNFVTLPRKWIKDNNLKKGDLVDMKIEGEKLIITKRL